MNRKSLAVFLVTSTLLLSACAGGTTTTAQQPASTMNPNLQTSAIDRAMEKALAQAEASGNSQEILAILGQVHRRSPEDAIVATRYGRALREDDQIKAAIRTLEPFTDGKKVNVEATTEMAMAQLAMGDFQAAEDYATRATQMDPKNARAYLALGTAQDAQGRHQDAEVAFREGVRHWQGDPSPILNNLALNLASQGHLEEALSLLKKAQKAAPNRIELERNRRIIATLLETTGPRPPAPTKKPDGSEPANETNDTSAQAVPAEESEVEKIVEEAEAEADDTPVQNQGKTNTTFNVKLRNQ
jgi:Flp pilus assembly protein TadD